MKSLRHIFAIYWKPSWDLAVVAASWTLVVGALYTATTFVGQNVWGGMAYFILYALVDATLFGVGIALFWMVVVRRRPLADLGLTTKYWIPSIILQLVFATLQYVGTLANQGFPHSTNYSLFLPLH